MRFSSAVWVAGSLVLCSCSPAAKTGLAQSSTRSPSAVPSASPPPPATPRSTANTWTIQEGAPIDDLFVTDAMVLEDGRVLALARYTTAYVSVLAILEKDQKAWRVVKASDAPAYPTPLGSGVLTKEGAIFAEAWLGDSNNRHRGGVRWNAKDDTWTEIPGIDPSATDDLIGGTVTRLADGRLLVTGGVTRSQRPPTFSTKITGTDGTFETAGPLGTHRLEHTATLLRDGRVLVVGGKTTYGRSPSSGSTELFDPKTKAWTNAGALATPRQGHTATLLADGRVLVAGGNAGAKPPTGELEIFDPKTNHWAVVGQLREPRTHHSATLLPDGRVIFIGGVTNEEDELGYDTGYTRLTNGEAAVTAEIFDPLTKTFAPPFHVPTGRFDHVTKLLPDGRLLVVGGTLGTLAKKPEPMQIWEPVATEPKRAVTVEPAPAILPRPTVKLDDGRILAFDGETWDPADTKATTQGKTPPAHFDMQLLVAPLGGGEAFAVDPKRAFHFTGGKWKDVPPSTRLLGTMRAMHGNGDDTSVTAVDADRVLFIGGGKRPWNAELWSRTDEKFVPGGNLARPRRRHAATLLDDGRVLVTGGEGEPPYADGHMPIAMAVPRGPTLAFAEVWSPKTKTFAPAGAMREPRLDPAIVLLADGRVLVTGGSNRGVSKTAEIWSPKTSSWSAAAPMKNARTAHTLTRLADGTVLALGGDQASLPSTAELYDPVQNAWTTLGPLPELWWGHQAFLLKDGRILVTTKTRSLVVTLAK